MIKRVKYYTLLKKVGEGGMGTVYKAEDDRNGKIVAIKELDPQKAQIEDYRTRFSREERILTRLNHPNIVFPIEAFAEDGTLYIAMEYVEGQSLDYKIRKISGAITVISARDLMIKMLEGFSHAHQAGVIHRDIKPANILISDNGELKITDFGIAKITTGEERTTANIKVGTLCYMSPEQLTTADVDERSDIYSLGMTFYEMLAGQLPFTKDQRENPGALTLRISNPEPFLLPSNFYPHIPKRIESIVMRMLEKDIKKRYSSMKEVLNELQQFDLSDPERTLMEEDEKKVAFDRTILTQGKRSESDVPSSSSKTPTLKDKPIKEMTWEEREERARILEAEFRETKRVVEEERQRRIEEERRQNEEEIRSREEERLRKDREEEEEIERARLEREQKRREWERKIAEEKARQKKWMLSTGIGVICVILLIVGYNIRNNYLKEKQLAEEKVAAEKQFLAELKNNMVLVEGKIFTEGGKSWPKFEIVKFEITQELWVSVTGSNPSKFKGSKRPVENVSWFAAVEFCNKLSEREGLQRAYSGSGDTISCDFNANGYRLPTEAEWEYAAKGGSKSKGYEYSGSNKIDEVAWYDYNSGNATHEAGKKQPNELGLYDMTGNVWEWCWDNSDFGRVLRGGGWDADTRGCGVTYSFGSRPENGYGGPYGFRLVRTK